MKSWSQGERQNDMERKGKTIYNIKSGIGVVNIYF